MRISYSALESFLICPAKYKFSEIDKIKGPKSKEAVFGTLIHKTLQIIHDTGRIVPPTEEEVLKYFSQSWNRDIYSSESEEAIAFEQGVRMIKDYYAKNYPANFHVIALESFFEAPIMDGDETHFVTGKIDRIDKLKDDTLEVIDYKTSRSLPAQKNVDENLQLAIYHLGIINRWPSLAAKPIKLSLYFLRHGEKLTTQKKADEAEVTKNKILEAIDKIKKSDFAPTPNGLCDWCEFQPQCPYFSHKFKSPAGGETIDDKKIKAAIDEYLEIKDKSKKNASRLAELAEIFNRYCDDRKIERIFGENGYISRTSQARYSYDSEKLLEILKAIGKLDKFLSVDVKKLAKSLDDFNREEKQKIEAARTKKEFKTLSAKRK